MQVILDSLFARPGSAPTGGGKKESSGTGLRHCMLKRGILGAILISIQIDTQIGTVVTLMTIKTWNLFV